MEAARNAACLLLLLCPLALTRHDDDFAFDNSDEFQVELTANHSEIAKNGLRRLWGVPDTTAYVGHLFRVEIPKEAFTGDVLAYKVRSENGRRTPGWLAVDSKHGLISGVPLAQDLGPHTLVVTAHGRTAGLTATDTFTVEVRKAEEKPESKYGTCRGRESRLQLVILVDAAFHRIPTKHRIRALMDLANFMALDWDEFWIAPYKPDSSRDQTVLMSGPGNTAKRKGEATTAIYLNAGCGSKLWPRHAVLAAGLREQARDGTLAQLLRLPVLGWRLVAPPHARGKRQLGTRQDSGSGDYGYDNEEDVEDGDYSGYDDDNDDDDYSPVDFGPTTDEVLTPMPHPHRHHHGDAELSPKPTHTPTNPPPPTTTATDPSPVTTATAATAAAEDATTTEGTLPPTTEIPTTNAFTTEEHKVFIAPYPESASEATNINISRVAAPRFSPDLITPDQDTPLTTEAETQTVIIRASNEIPSPPPSPETPETTSASPATDLTSSTAEVTSPSPPTTSATVTTPVTPPVTVATAPPTTQSTVITTDIPESTISEVTQQETSLSTERSSTIIGRTTETVTFLIPAMNKPPALQHHMKKLAITAGKAFRYIIPADLFTDAEDGNNLTLSMYEAEGVALDRTSWIQFNQSDREVYGLPLESQVSRWNFIVEARDSEGAVAKGPLDITVQQHKSRRTINHKFILQFKLNKNYKYAIDWQIRALEGLVNLFRDTDMDHLTVLNATSSEDGCEFVWTNDTLPKDVCPMDDIKRLMTIMESDSEPGSPSASLARAMLPELKVSGVSWQPSGKCAELAPNKPTAAPDTYPPVTRNQVDHLTATIGHLLVYKVHEDTFFDPEDGGTRNLHLSLRYSDRSALPPGHWLQFDHNNQEFYGVPAPRDHGPLQYQLVAEDSTKKSAYDSLIVEVVKAPTIKPTVEFQMTMEYPFANLAYNAANKRKVVEKLAALFGQSNTDSIRISSITDNPTTIVWYNTSLPMDRCPKKEIEDLRKMIISDERGTGSALRDNVDQVFDKDFKVMSIRLIPLGLCAEQNTKVPKVTAPVQTGVNQQNSKAGAADNGYTEYLVTFVIPAVVIVCMILVAGVIACVLYRRRRTGKMSVGDEEERQAFRSKGIPVIFQDELEEQASTEPLHKSPVIMREEKPPLLPPAPDYRAASYRAPPPPAAAAASAPPRHKPTPSYRKPPPYVPP